jgi:cytochrome c-type biogenesis protein
MLACLLLAAYCLLLTDPSFAARPPLVWETEPAKPALPAGFLPSAMISLLAGILSFLSPCTLPVLPAYFAFTFQSDRKRIVLMTIAFFMGLATSFSLMGGAATAIGSLLKGYMALFVRIGGGVILTLGIFSLIGKGFSGVQFQGRPAATFIGSFIFGLSFSIGWSACVGPILAAILVIAATQERALSGMLLLFIYAMGLGLPLVILSLVFNRLDREGLFWRFIKGKGWDISFAGRELHIHTNNLISGLLFISLGALMLGDYLSLLNRIIPVEAQMWYARLEEKAMEMLK